MMGRCVRPARGIGVMNSRRMRALVIGACLGGCAAGTNVTPSPHATLYQHIRGRITPLGEVRSIAVSSFTDTRDGIDPSQIGGSIVQNPRTSYQFRWFLPRESEITARGFEAETSPLWGSGVPVLPTVAAVVRRCFVTGLTARGFAIVDEPPTDI